MTETRSETPLGAMTAPSGLTGWWLDSEGRHDAPLAGWDASGAPLLVRLDGTLRVAPTRLLVLRGDDKPKGWRHAALLLDLAAADAETVTLLDRSKVIEGALAHWVDWVSSEAEHGERLARDVVSKTQRNEGDLAFDLVIPGEVTAELARAFVSASMSNGASSGGGNVW